MQTNNYVIKLDEDLDSTITNLIIEKPGPSISSTPSNRNSSEEIIIPNISLLLDKTLIGRAIKSIYQIEKHLDSRCQSYLTDLIVQHFVNAVPFQ